MSGLAGRRAGRSGRCRGSRTGARLEVVTGGVWQRDIRKAVARIRRAIPILQAIEGRVK